MIRLLIVIALLTITPSIGLSETYKWRDDKGTLGFTDDISKVPEKYRNQLKIISSPNAPSSKQSESKEKIINNDSKQSPSIDTFPGSPLDTLLRNKWDMMIALLKRSETQKALDLIHPEKRNDYKKMFDYLDSQLPFIVSTQSDFEFIRLDDQHAVLYELTTNEKGITYSYEVRFEQDTSGVWWIYDF